MRSAAEFQVSTRPSRSKEMIASALESTIAESWRARDLAAASVVASVSVMTTPSIASSPR